MPSSAGVSQENECIFEAMRQIWAFILCISVSAPFAAGYLVVHLLQSAHQYHVSQQMGSGQVDSEIVILRFSPEDFQSLVWEHSREFEWQGDMYDVVAISEQGAYIEVSCWMDSKEKQFNLIKTALKESGLKTPAPIDQQVTDDARLKIQLNLPASGLRAIIPGTGRICAVSRPSLQASRVGPKPPVPPPDQDA